MMPTPKRLRFALLLVLVTPALSVAQTSGEEDTVREVIHRLFRGMEKGDSAMVHASFADEVTLASIFRDKSRDPALRRESSIDDFLKAIGTPHQQVWYEETWGLTIKVDDDLAQAWCHYAFYLGHTFSHCGVDAFQLHKGKNGWKIFHLADTRRKEGCDVREDIKNKHRDP